MGFRKRYMPSALLGKIRLLYNIIEEEFEKKKKQQNLKFCVSYIGNYFKNLTRLVVHYLSSVSRGIINADGTLIS